MVATVGVFDCCPRGVSVSPPGLLVLEAHQIVEGAAQVAGMMTPANVSAIANIDHAWLRIDRIEGNAELATERARAMHENMDMRISPRRVTLPNVKGNEWLAMAAAHPSAEIGAKAIEVFRPRPGRWQRARVGRERHEGV